MSGYGIGKGWVHPVTGVRQRTGQGNPQFLDDDISLVGVNLRQIDPDRVYIFREGGVVYNLKLKTSLIDNPPIPDVVITAANLATYFNSTAPTVGSAGEVNTGSNLGTAGDGTAQVFASKSGVDLRFRQLRAGSNITFSQDGNEITINSTGGGVGEANTTSNAGAGGASTAALALPKSGIDLPFRRLRAGTNVTLNESPTEVTINVIGGGLASATTTLTGSLTGAQETALADNTIHRNTNTSEVWIKSAGVVTKTRDINEYPVSEIVVGRNDVRTDWNIRNASQQADVDAMIAGLPSLKPNLNSTIPNESTAHKIVLKSGVYGSNFLFDRNNATNQAAQGFILESAGNRQMAVLAGASSSAVPVVKVTDSGITGGDPLATSNPVADGASAKTQGFELNNVTVLGDNTTARPVDIFAAGFRSKNLLVQSVKKPVRFKFSGATNGGTDGLFSRINTEALVEGLTVRFNRGSTRVALADYATLLSTTPAANTFYTTPKDRIVNGDHGAIANAKDRFHLWVWDDTIATPAYGLKQILWSEDVNNAAALPAAGNASLYNGKIYRLRDNKEYRMWDSAANIYRTVFEASPNAALLMNGSTLEIETGDGRYTGWNIEDPRGHGIIIGTDAASSKFSNGHIYGGSLEQRAGYYQKNGSLYSYGNDIEGDYGSSILGTGGNFSVGDKHYNFDIGYEIIGGNNFYTANRNSLFLGFAKLGRTVAGGAGNSTAFGNTIRNIAIDWRRNRNDGRPRSPYYFLIDNHNSGNWWNVMEGLVGEMGSELIVTGETNQTPTANDTPVDIIKETEEFRRNRNWYDIKLYKFGQGKGFVYKNDPSLGINLEAKLVFNNDTSGTYTHSREFPQQVVAFGSTLTANRIVNLTNATALTGDQVFLNFNNVNFAGFTVTVRNAASTTLAVVPKKMMICATFNGTQWVLDSKEVADNIYFEPSAAAPTLTALTNPLPITSITVGDDFQTVAEKLQGQVNARPFTISAVITSATTLTANQFDFVKVQGAATSYNVTLPLLTAGQTTKEITIKRVDNVPANQVRIVPSGSNKIDNLTSRALVCDSTTSEAITLVPDEAAGVWWIK